MKTGNSNLYTISIFTLFTLSYVQPATHHAIAHITLHTITHTCLGYPLSFYLFPLSMHPVDPIITLEYSDQPSKQTSSYLIRRHVRDHIERQFRERPIWLPRFPPFATNGDQITLQEGYPQSCPQMVHYISILFFCSHGN